MRKKTTMVKPLGVHDFSEALEKFGINFEVDRISMYTLENEVREVHQAQVIVRKDTGDHLGIVSPKYPVVSPSSKFECLKHFGDGMLEYMDGGTFGKFKAKVYLQARISGNMSIASAKGEEIEKRITLVSSYDGTKSNELMITPYRLPCHNGFSIPEHSLSFKLRNTRHLMDKLEHASVVLSAVIEEYNRIDSLFEKFMNYQIENEKTLRKFVEHITPSNIFRTGKMLTEEGEKIIKLEDVSTKLENKRIELIKAIHEGFGQKEILHMTLWKLFNGVSTYVNNSLAPKKKDRFEYIYFGGGNLLIEKAYSACSQIIDGTLEL